MKGGIARRFAEYLLNNYIGNFLGFIVGSLSTRVVANYFTTRSIRNLWGLAAHGRTVVTKHTYTNLEWMVSILVGFIVFELISKSLQKMVASLLPKYKLTRWMVQPQTDKEAVEAAVKETTEA